VLSLKKPLPRAKLFFSISTDGGDWNLVLDEKDKKGGSTKLSHTKNREKLKSFIDRNNLTDVWRTLNPELERYTWRQKTPNVQ
jgi:exonuclease III